MSERDWSRFEVEAIVDDYLSMLASELAGVPYNKTEHRRSLLSRLNGRSEQAIEFKHANISAVLLDAGFPPIPGYKPRFNYQALLAEVVGERMAKAAQLQDVAAVDADRPLVVPEVDDILAVLTGAPKPKPKPRAISEPSRPVIRLTTNYIEREARNRSLGLAGELFVVNYERARLISLGKESLASRIEHTSKVRGDGEGYDILSFEASGEERLIEVKSTKYGAETPFFVTRNEVSVSEKHETAYHVYRLYTFQKNPKLYTLSGAISRCCQLFPVSFLASPN